MSASSGLPLETFFQSVFLSEADGAWYLGLSHEDRQGRPHTFSEALGGFEAFLRQQVSMHAEDVRRAGMHVHVHVHSMCMAYACACAWPMRVCGR